MARKNTRAATKVLPDLPFDMGADDAKIGGAPQGEQITVAQLQEQIKAMQGQLENANKTNLALMTQAPVIQPQLKPTEVDTKNLPDPVAEPEAYAVELAKRTRQAIRNEAENAQIEAGQKSTANDKIAGLWEDFREAYPEYAKDQKKIEFVATEVAEKAAKRGRDVSKYMFGASSIFFADAVAEYDKLFGKPKGAEAEDGDDDDDDGLDDDVGRTRGIPGGGPSGRSSAVADEDANVSQSMFDGLKKWQLKNGFTL